MSIGFVPGLIGSAAGAPLAQSKGSEIERSQQDAGSQKRTADSTKKADAASGIGQTSEDQETSDRDADGRRIWEIEEQRKKYEEEEAARTAHKSKDATGLSGNQVDLSG
jgi:hypothetical protein